jgi:hypothetical protein
MTFKKSFLKYIIWTLIIGFICVLLGYFYLKNTSESFVSEAELTEFVTKIKIAEELPDQFYLLYEKEHPNSLTKNLNENMLNVIFLDDFEKSPSLLAATISEISRQDSDTTKISNRKAYTLAWKIEEETTQRECLNWVLKNYKFDLYIHGINELATYYFKKEVSDLSDRELMDVIDLMTKPSIVHVPDRSNEKLY